MLSDLEQIERRLERVEKSLKRKKAPAIERGPAALLRCKASIESEHPLRELEFTSEERKVLTGFMFLSLRPMLYVLNLGDDEADKLDSAVEQHGGAGACWAGRKAPWWPSAGASKRNSRNWMTPRPAELLAAYGLKEPGLHRLIRATYDLLGLISFFTAGEPEVRAWTIRRGTTRRQRRRRDPHRHRARISSAPRWCAGRICSPPAIGPPRAKKGKCAWKGRSTSCSKAT